MCCSVWVYLLHTLSMIYSEHSLHRVTFIKHWFIDWLAYTKNVLKVYTKWIILAL